MRRWLELGQAPANVVAGPSGDAAQEELTKMVHNLQIAQARKEGGVQSHEWRLPNDLRCMWCNGVGHIRRDYSDFTEALGNNMVYLWND